MSDSISTEADELPADAINAPYFYVVWALLLAPAFFTVILITANHTDYGANFISEGFASSYTLISHIPAVARYSELLESTPYEENLPIVGLMFSLSNSISLVLLMLILFFRVLAKKKIFTRRIAMAVAGYQRWRVAYYVLYATALTFALYGPLNGLNSRFLIMDFGPESGGFRMLWTSLSHAMGFGALLWWIDERLEKLE